MEKAANDSNSIVRMLAVKDGYLAEEDNPELYIRLTNDDSPLVRAALKADGGRCLWNLDLLSLSQVERLGVIALAHIFNQETFIAFISDGLSENLLSEDEAAELVTEYILNPKLVKCSIREDWDISSTKRKEFEKMWNLTTSTSPKVHSTIAWEYPTKTDGALGHSIPDEMLERMSPYALEALAYRQFGPLFKKLTETPEKFDQSIHDAARNAALAYQSKSHDQTEIASLREELREFRAEVKDCLGALAQHISKTMSRRKGLFW
jgi:hypothetical protein